MLNVRASFHRRLLEVLPEGFGLVTEPDAPWSDPCVRVEWLDAALPRGLNRYSRSVRVHVRGTMDTYTAELQASALIKALGLGNAATVTVAPLYDYTSSSSSPAQVGTFEIERSPRGVSVLPSPTDNPAVRHLVVNLVVVAT